MNAASQPKTIRQMLGAEPGPGRLADSVLLIIDAQREYVDGKLRLAGIEESLAVGGVLLARARAAGTPVVHVLHRGGAPLFNPEGIHFQPAAPLIPLPGEAIVEKTMANSFAGTDLQAVLEKTGRKSLIVIGYMTHNCVSSTVRAAIDRGYRSTVVATATATRDLPDGQGGVLAAEALQAASLIGLSDTIATVVAHAEDIPE